jgi:NAD(P)-dependent dehydrogenase (short-subunit alcohol dehydrogenase family)
MSVEQIEREFAVNSISLLFAAREAVNGFKQLPSSASKTFIVTGNMMNVVVKPSALISAMGKTAAAHMMESASVAYGPLGIK